MASSPLSSCVKRISESPTLAITAKAAELKAAGQDVIGLGAGEPDFDTLSEIKKAAIEKLIDETPANNVIDYL